MLCPLTVTGALTFALLIALQAEPLEPSDAPPPEVASATVTGTMGGAWGAASGCAIGAGVPTLVGSAGGGVLYWLYSGAAAGAILGWTPALAALGTSCGIGASAIGLPLLGASGAAIGAMVGAKNDGRDPMPALYGALPGIGLAGISTALSCTAMAIGCGGGLAAAQPVIIIGVLAIATGIAAPPCAAIGAGVADVAWGNPEAVKPEEPVDATALDTKPIAMRF